MNHLITCDECGNEFYVMIREKTIDKEENVVMSYLKCPVCHKEYPFTYVDDTVRRLQRIQRDIKTMENDPPKYVQVQYNQNKKKIKEHMDYLKNKYCKEN